MLNKKNRLTKNGSFMYVYRKGLNLGSDYLSLNYVLKQGEPKIGFSVNNKIGHAVVRNRVKRHLRAIIRELLPNIRGCQLVFTAKIGIQTLSYSSLREIIIKQLIKVGLYEEKKV